MKIRKEILDDLDIFKLNRRELHKYPEIEFNTFQTIRRIERMAEYDITECDGFSGIFYVKGKSARTIAFRCELDGLEMKEMNENEYASKNGFMHACGHDAHIAILLATLRYFIKYPPDVSIVLILQPAEESGCGAKHILSKGIFEKYSIEMLFATHVMPNLGDVIACREKEMMAQSCEVTLKIHGKNAHVGHFKEGIDSLKGACLFLNKVYELHDELLPNVLHFGKIESGTIRNGVSDLSILQGTLRSFDPLIFYALKELMVSWAHEIDCEIKTNATLHFSSGYDVVYNDSLLVEMVRKIAGTDYLEIEKLYTSEDFSFYKEKCPCCMFLCGLSSKVDLHDSFFDLSEEECLKAVEMNVSLVEAFSKMI